MKTELFTVDYSIIETCKLNGVEPFAYITDIVQKIACGWTNARLDELMPWAWKHTHELAEGQHTRPA